MSELGPRQKQAVVLVAQGRAKVLIAGDLQISRETLRRWEQRETFQREVRRLRDEAAERAASLVDLRAALAAAAERIETALKAGDMAAAAEASRIVERLTGVAARTPPAEPARAEGSGQVHQPTLDLLERLFGRKTPAPSPGQGGESK